MEDCLDTLGDAEVFTCLDCSARYWQVPLFKDDLYKTAFTAHYGIHHRSSTPFFLTNAPATFQRALDIIPCGSKWRLCLVYFDHVIIISAVAQQHVKDIGRVLHRILESRAVLNLEKCTWLSDDVEYRGHIFVLGQLRVHNKSVNALKHAKFASTNTQLKTSLGMCNVY